MTNKKLVQEVVSNFAGPEVMPLVEELKKHDNYNENILAQKLKIEIHAVRSMLYALYKSNLVTFTRKKDRQKGIYIYFWTFSPKHIQYQSLMIKQQRLSKLKERLTAEEKVQYFICPSACSRLPFEEAINLHYKCPECGSLLNMFDNSKTVGNLKLMIKDLEKELKV